MRYILKNYFTNKEDENPNWEEKIYFCSNECKYKFKNRFKGIEGEWQNKEDYKTNGGVFGYIYCIYNRKEDIYYVGQTRYMPFFRWQEHVKSGLKGDIIDLSFSVITEVKYNDKVGISENQELLNNIESWWIKDYIETYGEDKTKNISIPKFTIEYYENLFKQIQHKIN